MDNRIEKMTIEEKASLLSGKDNWHTKPVESADIPSIMMTDGPHGVRKMLDGEFGINSNIKATCFPTASCICNSWDIELANKMAKCIAKEAKANNVAIVLGPGANIKRSPLCGRNFEYFSEDPVLSGNMAGNFIKGMNDENVGCSLKHFACNNQDYRRFIESNNIDKRAIMDIYLKSFKTALEIAKPATIMCAYNKIDEEYCSENKWLLKDILRDKFGFDGFVMSDWGAVNDRVKAVKAGLDLEMPSCNGVNDKKVVKAVQNNLLDIKDIDIAVDNILKVIDKYKYINDLNETFDEIEHYNVAREIAEKSAILLKNHNKVLPLNKEEKVLIVGRLAKESRYQGGGSSHITPFYETSLCEALDKKGIAYDYMDGYHEKYTKNNKALIASIKEKALQYDKIVICVGLPDYMEVEGLDRKHLSLPKTYDNLVNEVASIHKNVVAVLFAGSAVELPWRDSVSSILAMYLAGSASGEACANLLYGEVNPSGRLAESYPIHLCDTPTYNNYYYDAYRSYYSESIYIGYRYYDKVSGKTAYPFGYGLSYTDFWYKTITFDKTIDIAKGGKMSVTLQNIGSVDGSEVIQVYIGKKDSKYLRPLKELKLFRKVFLQADETQTIDIELTRKDFEIYDIERDKYLVENGNYQIYVAKNADEIIKVLDVNVISKDNCAGDTKDMLEYIPQSNKFDLAKFEKIYGKQIMPLKAKCKKGEYTELNCLGEIAEHSLLAKFILWIIGILIPIVNGEDRTSSGFIMSYEHMKSNPLFKLGQTSGGALNEDKIQGFVNILNGHLFKGLKLLFSKSQEDNENAMDSTEINVNQVIENNVDKEKAEQQEVVLSNNQESLQEVAVTENIEQNSTSNKSQEQNEEKNEELIPAEKVEEVK